MKQYHLIALFICGITASSLAQTTDGEAKLRKETADTTQGWKKGGVIALSMAQTSLTNWAAGGQNSLSANGLFSTFANYHHGKHAWDNNFDVGYGILKQGKKADLMKTDDKIDLLSKYGYKAFDGFYYAALLNFKTQMTVGRDYKTDTSKISNFLAPAYTLLALGLDYKPNSHFSAFIAPITGKITIVNDQDLADAGAYGVKAATYDATGVKITDGERSRSEFGGYVRLIYSKNDFKSEALKNMSLTTKADLFSNYLKNPQNIDVSWETQIAFKVNKYISANLNTHLLYDDDIKIAVDKNNDGIIEASGPRVQFKEILGVGFSYKF